MEIGIQQLMVGKTLTSEKKAAEVLQLIKENHFTSIELNGFMIRKMPPIVKILTDLSGMPTGASSKLDWKSLTEKAGLKVLSVHEDLGTIESKMEMVIEECRKYSTKTVVVTGMYQFDYDLSEELQKLTERLNEVGKKLKEAGIRFLYHNHNVEFGRLPSGITSYEYIVTHTDPEFVNFELDAYWATDAGMNVPSLMEFLAKRLCYLHITDRQKKKYGKAMTPIVKFDAAELGTGIMDIPCILEKAKKQNVEAVILETHRNWKAGSPVQSFIISGDYLNKYLGH